MHFAYLCQFVCEAFNFLQLGATCVGKNNCVEIFVMHLILGPLRSIFVTHSYCGPIRAIFERKILEGEQLKGAVPLCNYDVWLQSYGG